MSVGMSPFIFFGSNLRIHLTTRRKWREGETAGVPWATWGGDEASIASIVLGSFCFFWGYHWEHSGHSRWGYSGFSSLMPPVSPAGKHGVPWMILLITYQWNLFIPKGVRIVTICCFCIPKGTLSVWPFLLASAAWFPFGLPCYLLWFSLVVFICFSY